jgi:hypothetical protein
MTGTLRRGWALGPSMMDAQLEIELVGRGGSGARSQIPFGGSGR